MTAPRSMEAKPFSREGRGLKATTAVGAVRPASAEGLALADLVRVDVAQVLRHVAATCGGRPAVLAAYVFGSALGDMRPDSDIDVGVVLEPGARERGDAWGPEGEIEAALGWVGDHPCHVTVLCEREAIFAVRAINGGRLAYAADAGRLSDFLERVARLNWQNAWRYWEAVREVNGWDPHPTRGDSPVARGM